MLSLAVLAPNQALDIDHVPEGAIPLKDTVCSAHILVSPAGVAEQITVTQSTDLPNLDKICADAIRPLKFIPAQLNGHSIAAATDVWVGWSTSNMGAPSATANTNSTPLPHEKVLLSPQLIQTIQLKGLSLGMQKAAGSADRARCLISLWYTGDGVIRAAQLVKSSGFPLIDQACLQVVIGQQVEPLASEREFGGWSRLPIDWMFSRKAEGAPPPQMEPDPSIPALTPGGSMHLLANYPPAALARHAQGICKMHVSVSATGAVSALEITQSTGSTALDQACKDALYGSPYVPATINWRLPSSNLTR
jgi:TonB family protein